MNENSIFQIQSLKEDIYRMSCQAWDNTLLNKIKESADFLLQAIANIIREFYEQY